MAHDAPSQEFIYDQVKATILSGVIGKTERIDLQPLADRFRVSVTPIREVLFRLMGEGLVKSHDFGGFQPLVPGSIELQHLYAWNGHHLLSAAHLLPDPVMRQVLKPFEMLELRDRVDTVAQFERLSLAIATATGISEFEQRVTSASERLYRARRAETLLFPDLDRELRSLVKVNGFDVRNNVRRRVTAYHRRRVEAAAQIAALL